MLLPRGPRIHPDAYVGLVDAVLTLAVTLCNAGLLSRAELAVAFDETARQQREGGASDSRRAAVCSIVVRHATVVQGGVNAGAFCCRLAA